MMAAWCAVHKWQGRSTNGCPECLERLRASTQAARRALEAITAPREPGTDPPEVVAREALATMDRLEER
jgi:hypothetical protein